MNVLAGAAAVGPLADRLEGRAGVCDVCEREAGSISCNRKAISAENIYNFLSI